MVFFFYIDKTTFDFFSKKKNEKEFKLKKKLFGFIRRMDRFYSVLIKSSVEKTISLLVFFKTLWFSVLEFECQLLFCGLSN